MFAPIVKLKNENSCHYLACTPTLILYALQGKLRITNVLTTSSRKIVCQVVQMETSQNDVVVLDEHFCTWHTVDDVDLSSSFSFEVDQMDKLCVSSNNILCYNSKELLLIKQANENGHQYRLSIPNNCAFLDDNIYISTDESVKVYDLDMQLRKSYTLANVVAIQKVGVLVAVSQLDSTMIVYAWDKLTFKNTQFLQILTIPHYIIICCPNKLLFIHQQHVIRVELPETLIMAKNTIYKDELYIYLLFRSEIIRYEIKLSNIESLNKILVDVEPFDFEGVKEDDLKYISTETASSLNMKIEEDRMNQFKSIIKGNSNPKTNSKQSSKNSSQVNLQQYRQQQKQLELLKQSVKQEGKQQRQVSPQASSLNLSQMQEEIMRNVQLQLQDQQSLQNAKYESFLKVVSQSLKQGLTDSFDKFAKQQNRLNVEEITNSIVSNVDSKVAKSLKALVVDAFIPKLEIIVDHLLKQVDTAVEARVHVAVDAAMGKLLRKDNEQSDIMQLLKNGKNKHLIEDSDNEDEIMELYKNGYYGLFIQQCINNNNNELDMILELEPDIIFSQISPILCLQLLTWLFDNILENTDIKLEWIRKGVMKINHRVIIFNLGCASAGRINRFCKKRYRAIQVLR